jgi:ADP-ribosylation factor-like protein 2
MRLELCKKELFELLQQERLAGASLLIFANKQDIEGALSADEIARVLELESNEAYQNRHWKIQSCSAVTAEGLGPGMDWMVEDIASRIFMLS